MKNISRSLFFLSLIFVFFGIFSINPAEATVGGPVYIHSFKYNPTDESVYFVRTDHGGRGCPPELLKKSLVTGKEEIVFSCDDGEKLAENMSYEGVEAAVNAKIESLTKDFKNLIPINLRNNDIAVDLQFLRNEQLSPEISEITTSVFNMSIFQNENKVLETTINGCSQEQPFTFMGYAIPGFNQKIMMLVSAKRDCYESGYINETLLVVGGVNELNKEYLDYYKGDGPVIPNEGTLTVYENDSIAKIVSDESSETGGENKAVTMNYFVLVPVALLALVLGFIAGKFKKRGTENIVV